MNDGRCKSCGSGEGMKVGPVNDLMINDLINLVNEYENAVGRQFLNKSLTNVNDWKDMQPMLKNRKLIHFTDGYTSTPNRDATGSKNINFTKDFTAIERDLNQPNNCTMTDSPLIAQPNLAQPLPAESALKASETANAIIIPQHESFSNEQPIHQQSPLSRTLIENVDPPSNPSSIKDVTAETKNDSIHAIKEMPVISKKQSFVAKNANSISNHSMNTSKDPCIGGFPGVMKTSDAGSIGGWPPEMQLTNNLAQVCLNLKQMFEAMATTSGIQMSLVLPEIGQVQLQMSPISSQIDMQQRTSVSTQTDPTESAHCAVQTDRIDLVTVEQQTELIEQVDRCVETDRLFDISKSLIVDSDDEKVKGANNCEPCRIDEQQDADDGDDDTHDFDSELLLKNPFDDSYRIKLIEECEMIDEKQEEAKHEQEEAVIESLNDVNNLTQNDLSSKIASIPESPEPHRSDHSDDSIIAESP